MSYDLFLKPESQALSQEQFTGWFESRPNYTIQQQQAWYENDDTGVYFSFDYDSEQGGSVAFNMNYLRPHIFGLEAAPELAAFIAAFDLSIDDPQVGGMGEGPFSEEGFVKSWNGGNRFGYQSILTTDETNEIPVRSTADIERTWRWNRHRNTLQAAVGDVMWIPRIMHMQGTSSVITVAVWPDACPTMLPRVDRIILLREMLAVHPRKPGDEESEATIVDWSRLADLVESYPYDPEHGCYCLEYDVSPEALVCLIQSLPIDTPDRDKFLSPDSVLNAELVAEFQRPG